jgi:hypothetical protein
MPDLDLPQLWDKIFGFPVETLFQYSFWFRFSAVNALICLYYFLRQGEKFSALRSEVMAVLFSEVDPIIGSRTEEFERRLILSNKLLTLGTKVEVFEDNKFYVRYLKKIRGTDVVKARKGLIGLSNTIFRNDQRNIDLGLTFRHDVEKGLKIRLSLSDETAKMILNSYLSGR